MVLPTSTDLLYADSSALVKLLLDEPERSALESYLKNRPPLASSGLALVEVTRAAIVANPATGLQEADRLLKACEVIDVDEGILDHARRLVDPTLRALDAIHLASALLIGPQELVAYDRRLLRAASAAGLATASPGA